VPWFTPIAQRLVREAAPVPGERALDVGCGRGAALFPLADAVGPAGRVTGIDLAPRMVDATRAEAAARGLANVELYVMDAGAPSLPAGGYDLVVSSLVVFFLPDPAGALRAWRELLAPGGRLAMSTFGSRDPRWAFVDDLFLPYLTESMRAARADTANGPFVSDASVERLVASAGYGGVRTSGFELETVFADADQWYAWSWSHGQRMMWELVPEADLAKVRTEAAARAEACRDEDGRIRLRQRIRLTFATHSP
jgi:SAM-dependent methyltransferase